MSMLSFCATATSVQLDPSSQYLFLADSATHAVHVAAIDLFGGKIIDTGYAMPMTSLTPQFAFSPDGSIVYAILTTDGVVHFYHVDPASGSLSEASTPLPLTSSAGFCPAEHQ